MTLFCALVHILLIAQNGVWGRVSVMRRRRRNDNTELYFVAFGVGLLACLVFPSKFVVVLLGAALIFCGLSCGRR